MPNTGHIGNEAVIEVQDSGSTYRALQTRNDISLPENIDAVEVTGHGDDVRYHIPGLESYGPISLEGVYEENTVGYLRGIKRMVRGFRLYPFGKVSGNLMISGNCFVTSLTPSYQHDGEMAWNADLQVTGSITVGTYTA